MSRPPQPRRLAADAAHEFGGIALDRGRPLSFRLDGRRIDGFAGDTVLSAVLAAGIDAYGRFGDTVLGLTGRFAPLVAARRGEPLPMDRLPAVAGLDLVTVGRRRFGFRRRRGRTLDHVIDGIAEAPWHRRAPDTTLNADLLIVGGGVAGLAAADAAATAGHSVVLVERQPWLGGDARYFGPVGDEPSPDAVTTDLIARLDAHPNVTVLTHAELFGLRGSVGHLHRVADGRGTVVAVGAPRLVLATGSVQRLPVFAGNRLPGVVSAIGAYHLAKRYGVGPGRQAVVATQSNYGYRLALRLHDAGIGIGRIVDPRVNPQSRFVDFAKASGLKLAGGQFPLAAIAAPGPPLRLRFANTGTALAALELEADALIVSGPFQPDLALWMLAGGGTHWADGRLRARGHVEHVALAGAAAGCRSLGACLASGRNAVAELFGAAREAVEDTEIGAPYETPEAGTPIAPPVAGAPAFLDAGTSLLSRPDPAARPAPARPAQAPSLGDVAAAVELGLTAAADAGAVAEERSAPGGDLVASAWTPPAAAATATPPWLAGRFGHDTRRVHLIVDGKRRFARGALVYANSSAPDPLLAIGVIESEPPPGGLARVSSAALASTDRFIVETLDGPSPARIAPD